MNCSTDDEIWEWPHAGDSFFMRANLGLTPPTRFLLHSLYASDLSAFAYVHRLFEISELLEIRQPLVPTEGDAEKPGWASLGCFKSFSRAREALAVEILGAAFPILHKKPQELQYQQKQLSSSSSWSMQERALWFLMRMSRCLQLITRPNSKKTYFFMSEDA